MPRAVGHASPAEPAVADNDLSGTAPLALPGVWALVAWKALITPRGRVSAASVAATLVVQGPGKGLNGSAW